MKVNVLKILQRTLDCCLRIPEREVGPRTREDYLAEFDRMLETGSLDPYRPGMSRESYYFSRAALPTGARIRLIDLFFECLAAAEAQNAALALDCARRLHRVLILVEEALALEPPCEPGILPFDSGPSRWQPEEAENSAPAQGSKKNVLGELHKKERNWTTELWEGIPKDWEYQPALAVCLIVPVRTEELTEGLRNGIDRAGVGLAVNGRELSIEYRPAKCHRGRYGTLRTTVTVDWTIVGGPARFLADLCAGGRSFVSIASKDAFRKALGRLGERVFPKDVTITPYVLRHQIIADLKLTYGAGREVAIAAGQGTDKTQSRYGYVQHGRKLVGYLSIVAAREPVIGSVERARLLGKRRPRKPDSDR